MFGRRQDSIQPGRGGRRLLSGLGALLILALLAACTGGAGEPAEESDNAAEESEAAAEESEDAAEESEAAEWPSQTITWVLPHEPGGGSEADVRRLQPYLEEAFGVRIEVQFRTGASGATGWSSLLDEEPDGYTIGTLVMPDILVQPMVFDDPGYQSEEFTYISATVTAPTAFLVRQDSPYETLEDLTQDLETRPGEVTYSAVGTLSGSALAYGQFVQESGFELAYVPEPGGAGGLENSLLGGHIDVAGLNIGHRMRIGDDVRALAVASLERVEADPDLPTFRDLGYDVTASTVWGVIGPPGMPEEIVDQINQAIREA